MSKQITLGQTFHAVHELVGEAIVSEGALFIGNILLATNGDHLRAYKLRDQVPMSLTGSLDHAIYNATFLDYLHAAQNKGIASPMGALFSTENYHIDCEEIELDGHNFQPKLDAITQRLDELDALNALDAEVVAAFVTQLSAGGDAFALIDAKVLVETQRATQAEADLQSAIDVVQADVDQNESDADSAIQAVQTNLDDYESSNDLAVQAVQADVDANESAANLAIQAVQTNLDDYESSNDQALQTETAARVAAIDGEVIARNGAIATAVADLIDSAPGALDTLNELAAALGDDASFSASVTNSLAGKQPLDAHLTSVVTAGRTVQQLESLDTTSAISGLLAAKQNQLTHGIANGNTVQISAADVASGEFARFSASGLESRTSAEVKAELAVSKADVALGNVENTALSSWGGSSNVIQVGAVASGTWQGTAVADSYVASAATWNAKQTALTGPELAVVGANAFTNAYKQEVDDNTAKLTFPPASNTLLHTTHAGLHTAHTAALATKQPLLDTSSLYHDTGNNRLGLGTVSPGNMLHLHDLGGAASLKISRSLADNHVEINSHGMTKYGNGAGSTAWRFRQVTADPITFETANTVRVTVAGSGETTFASDVVLAKAVPASATATGIAGSIRVDADYIYVCTATDTWKRVGIATW